MAKLFKRPPKSGVSEKRFFTLKIKMKDGPQGRGGTMSGWPIKNFEKSVDQIDADGIFYRNQ